MAIKWAKQQSITDTQVKTFLDLFTNQDKKAIENIDTTFKVLSIRENLYFPVTINDTEWENSFVCSPYTAYVHYAKDELKGKVNHKIVQFLLFNLLNLIAKWLKKGQLNKNVHVNNFLLTTNPYPEWNGKEIEEITAFLTKEYPDHAIIFRSLNEHQHQQLLNQFEAKDYELIGSRQVYIFDLEFDTWKKKKNNKLDNKLIKKQQLTRLNHAEMGEHLEEALQLYQQLYLQKYSTYNPQFTLHYFQKCHESKSILFQGYKDVKNKLKAFSGLFIIDQTITSPLVGYDTSACQKEGLYIHAAQLAILHKFESNLLLNLSSGASGFKMHRGGQPSIEYSAIYMKHLSKSRQIRWSILRYLSNKIGVPLIKKYKL